MGTRIRICGKREEARCLSATILSYWFRATHARREYNRDGRPWHQYRAQQPPTVFPHPRRFSPPQRDIIPPLPPIFPPLRDQRRPRDRTGVVEGRNRPRSAPLVNIRPSQPPRNIWPGWPDVSYWRNMARAVKYSRSKLADGDVYLNNYTHTSCRPPFHISTSFAIPLFRCNSLRDTCVRRATLSGGCNRLFPSKECLSAKYRYNERNKDLL